MENHSTRSTILRVILALLLFSAFKSIDYIDAIADHFINLGWALSLILLVIVLIRMVFATVGLQAVFFTVRGFNSPKGWLQEYLRFDLKIALLGIISFIAYCALASLISLGMGIFHGDLSVVFSHPYFHPEGDAIGWGFFLLALVPGIWEELAFRGLIQSKLSNVFSPRVSVLLSATFFGLFHFMSIVSQSPLETIPGVIMGFFFGIAWGYMTVRSRSVIPAIISHYFIDSMGQILLNVDTSNQALSSGFFLLLTVIFPVLIIILTKLMYKRTNP